MRNRLPQIAILAAFVLVLSLPFMVRAMSGRGGGGAGGGGAPATPGGANVPTLIIVTPHVEQIRLEMAAGFSRWYKRNFSSDVRIDWRQPGGTSEIIKQLEAQFEAKVRTGEIDSSGVCKPGAIGFDIFLGGGSYEHGKVKGKRTVPDPRDPSKKITYTISQPAGFSKSELDAWFGENVIGTQTLYDPEQYWIGTALSGFGIVYNRDVLAKLGLPEPRAFGDLCDGRYANMLALADPRQSGSITTTFESIMNKEGWNHGWRILRELSANARYFASAATKVPVDVSQGEAAAGLAIDFYGRGQAQFTMKPGEDPIKARVGYVDPQGAVYIDADPVSIMNGASDMQLCKRFVQFCLSEEGQALWQFHDINTDAGRNNPKDPDGRPMGPDRYELRRMPVRRVMYEKYRDFMMDKSNPFELASKDPGRGWRGMISPLMAAFGADVMPDLRRAWAALNQARADAAEGRISHDKVSEMEIVFYAMPEHIMKDGSKLLLSEANFKAIYADADKFRDTEHAKRTTIDYTEFFRAQYRQVVRMASESDPVHGS